MKKKAKYERYSFEDSPWTQNLTQRDLATLLGWKKQQLEALVRDKERYVKRETKLIGSKTRNLAVPTGRLRTVHERLKFHLNKIRQPDYLYSPRKGRSQRDNAEHHATAIQFLSMDIRQFYPSTTTEHIFRWGHHDAGLRADVAGLLTKLVAIDGKMPFGSPVSPVLTTHVHRDMFDQIYAVCMSYGLKMSVWVDDFTISGTTIRGEIVEEIRSVIRAHGFDTHKIKFRHAARPVIVTGVPIQHRRVGGPRALHQRIQDGYGQLRGGLTGYAQEKAISQLLSALGTYRYHVGSATPAGRKTSDRMQGLRRRLRNVVLSTETVSTGPFSSRGEPATYDLSEAPWD